MTEPCQTIWFQQVRPRLGGKELQSVLHDKNNDSLNNASNQNNLAGGALLSSQAFRTTKA